MGHKMQGTYWKPLSYTIENNEEQGTTLSVQQTGKLALKVHGGKVSQVETLHYMPPQMSELGLPITSSGRQVDSY